MVFGVFSANGTHGIGNDLSFENIPASGYISIEFFNSFHPMLPVKLCCLEVNHYKGWRTKHGLGSTAVV